MNKYIALLRGINVGGKNKVEMKKLKAVFVKAGFSNVSTYINSGNLIFDSQEEDINKLLGVIKVILRKNFPFAIQLVIRDSINITKLVKAIPQDWQNNDEQRTDVLFLWDDYDNKKSLGLIKQTPGVDNVIYIKGAIVWNLKRLEINRSGMKKFIGTELYKNMTGRNINTVRKLAEITK